MQGDRYSNSIAIAIGPLEQPDRYSNPPTIAPTTNEPIPLSREKKPPGGGGEKNPSPFSFVKYD